MTGIGLPARGRACVVDGRPPRRRPTPRWPTRCASCSAVGASPTTPCCARTDGAWTVQGDPTEAAFLVAEAQGSASPRRRRARFQRVGEMPFTSERKLMSTLRGRRRARGPHRRRDQGRARRAAGPLHPRAGRRARSARSTDARRAAIAADVERLADLALRTLAVAYRPLPDVEPPTADRRRRPATPRLEALERELVYLGVVGIIDPPRDEARRRHRRGAPSAGVRIIMITGDHPRTAARIAADLGIAARRRAACHGRRARRGSTTTRSRAMVRDVVRLRRGSPPSTSCASSTPSRPTATSWP